MDDSPYRAPQEATADVPTSPTKVGERSLLPYAQLGLRLLGVMLIVEGVGSSLGGATYAVMTAGAYIDAGYQIPIDPHAAGWTMGGIPMILAGCYMTIGGRWLLESIFIPARQREAANEEQIDYHT